MADYAFANPPYSLSVGLEVQEGRDVEHFFLDRIARRRGAAVRIETLRSRMARIFRNRLCRAPFGVAGRLTERRILQLRQRCTTLDPVGDATPVVAQPAGEFREQAFRRLRLLRLTEIIDAGRHDRDADDTLQAFIEVGADDDVGVRVGLFAYAGSSFVNLE